MRRLVRFGAVGVLNTLVDLVVLNALLYAFAHGNDHSRLFPVLATVSFIAATVNSYLWNRHWTFRDEAGGGTKEASRFYLVTLVSFGINVGLSSLLVWLDPFPILNATLWANMAKLVATGLSLLINFVGYERLVFRTGGR